MTLGEEISKKLLSLVYETELSDVDTKYASSISGILLEAIKQITELEFNEGEIKRFKGNRNQ